MPTTDAISRRAFLAQAAAAGPAGALAVAIPRNRVPNPFDHGEVIETPQSAPGRRFCLDEATGDDFLACIETTFDVDVDSDAPFSLELIRVAERQRSPGSRGRVPFSLFFRGSGSERKQQDTYTVRHFRLGSFPLFLVPIGPPRDVVVYEAVFG